MILIIFKYHICLGFIDFFVHGNLNTNFLLENFFFFKFMDIGTFILFLVLFF